MTRFCRDGHDASNLFHKADFLGIEAAVRHLSAQEDEADEPVAAEQRQDTFHPGSMCKEGRQIRPLFADRSAEHRVDGQMRYSFDRPGAAICESGPCKQMQPRMLSCHPWHIGLYAQNPIQIVLPEK